MRKYTIFSLLILPLVLLISACDTFNENTQKIDDNTDIIYQIQFSANAPAGEECTGEMTTITDIKYDESIKLPTNKYSVSGYEFVYWKYNQNGTWITIQDGAVVTNLTATNAKTVVLYAIWTKSTQEPSFTQESALKGYTIVYGKYEAEEVMEQYPTYASYTEWDFNRLIAQEFNDGLFEILGYRLPIAKDTEKTVGNNEILIGNTNRNIALDFVYDVQISGASSIGKGDYVYSGTYPFQYEIGLVDDSIYIIGGCYGTTYAAANYFLDYLRTIQIENNGIVELPADLKLSGTHDLEVIGCIGDSITHGYEKETPAYVATWDAYNYFSYPAYLQRLYWKTAYVYNFGKGGTTMRSDSGGTYPYQVCYRWKNCAQSLANILDYVIIQLGTNDSKLFPTTPWTDEDNQQFIDDFFVLLTTLSRENSDIKFLMSNYQNISMVMQI